MRPYGNADPNTDSAVQAIRRGARAALRSIEDHLPLIAFVAIYVAAGAVAGAVLGVPVNRGLDPGALVTAASWCLLVLGIVVASYLAVFAAGRLGLGAAESTGFGSWSEFRGRYLSASRLFGFFIVLFVLQPFMVTFLGFKRAIPLVQPFAWDALFMEVDRALHFGRHPWEWLQPLFGYPRATRWVDILYYLWFPILSVTLVWQAWNRDRRLRMRFLLSYVAVWCLLGTVAATALSSAGPCYYGAIVAGPDPFESLMDYLRAVGETYPLIALDVQRYLWEGYVGSAPRIVGGISAMPSLHVAMPVLFAFVGWRTHRWLGVAYVSYAVFVVLGSVHLGWHYAIDGYASAAAVPLIWKGAGTVAARFDIALTARRATRASRSG